MELIPSFIFFRAQIDTVRQTSRAYFVATENIAFERIRPCGVVH